MGLGKRIFAACYDLINSGKAERQLAPYREQTAGRAWGDVLEVGAGTGANLPFYSPDVRLTVVEPNPHMAKRLRRKAAKLGRQVTITPGLGESLPFPDASFDSVVVTFVLCSVKDVGQVAREARRVLRPSDMASGKPLGRFYFCEHVAADSPRVRKWQDRLNWLWGRLADGCNLNRDIASAIREAGFSRVEVTPFKIPASPPFIRPGIVGAAWD
jgi:ubiquinone/menaquinone biosynthesis C-methylase UbiE